MSELLFADELLDLLRRHKMERGSDTSPEILKDYLMSCLVLFNHVVTQRELSYGRTVSAFKKDDSEDADGS